jgi:hypothetical protein
VGQSLTSVHGGVIDPDQGDRSGNRICQSPERPGSFARLGGTSAADGLVLPARSGWGVEPGRPMAARGRMDARIGLGIAISGTLNPAKVLNFFGVARTWNPKRSATS